GAELADSAARVEGVAAAEGIRSATVRVKTGPDQWRALALTARQDFQRQSLDKVAPVQGAWPPPRRELVIERSAFSLLNAAVGDEVTIEARDGKRQQVRIAGTAHDIGSPPAIFTGEVYGYATLETFEWLGLLPGGPAPGAAGEANPSRRAFTQLAITVAERPDDEAHIKEVAERVKRRVEQAELTVSGIDVPTPGEHPANEVIQPLLLTMGVLGTFSLFLSGFLVVNTVTALLTQQVPQIGVMKALGAGSGQLLRMYLGTVLVYGALAFLVAAPLAAGAGYGLSAYLASIVNFDLNGFSAPTEALLLEAGVALLVPLLAALWPVLSGTRLTVREALSARGGTGTLGRGWLDRAIERLRGLPRPLLLSLRNTFRRKARLALTLTTLTLGGAIFIGVLSLRSSIMVTLEQALEYFQYDVEVTLADRYRADAVIEEALRVPGVTGAEVWAIGNVRLVHPDGREGNNTTIFAPPAETRMVKPTLVEGRWLAPDDTDAIVLNTEALKGFGGVRVGDTITLRLGKKDTTWRVVGTVRSTLTGPIVYAPFPTYSRLEGSPGRAARLQVTTERHDTAAQEVVATALKTRLDESRLRVAATVTVGSLREGMVKQIDTIIFLMAAMAILMAVVGGLGLMGTMSINVLERTREIGIMRAIGAPTRAMLQIFVTEGVLIGGLSWAVGAVVAVPISKLMSDAIGQALFQTQLTYAFSLPGAGVWLGTVLALAALASVLPAARAARLTVREVLAYE
ncbi:MAG TPA: ABC transporter permease, partial [Chloroflexota bacterium]|nr:ABC transporter permease [Chloroflexota bacterium]